MLTLALAAAGCGRFGFDPVAAPGDDAGGDGAGGNGAGGNGAGGDGAGGDGCGTLAPTCGPTGTSPCCESPVVGGGSFYRSYDTADGVYPDMTNAATVSTFRFDKYEVTVGRFRQFVAAGRGTQANPPVVGAGAHANIPGSGWDPSWNSSLAADTPTLVAAIKCQATYQTWTDAPGGNESRPMNCIDWYEAMAFCAWDGGYLPSEAEWNYAASGGSLQRAYPWSSPATSLSIDDTRASYYVDATKQCFGDGVDGCALTDFVPVGSKPAGDGLWGQSDLGGNVWEFVLDWYAAPYPMKTCNDCANLTPGTHRVFRGGGFSIDASFLRASDRSFVLASDRSDSFGVRCARTP